MTSDSVSPLKVSVYPKIDHFLKHVFDFSDRSFIKKKRKRASVKARIDIKQRYKQKRSYYQ